MIKDWTHAKEYCFEDMLVYGLGLGIAFSWDILINFFIAFGFYAPSHEVSHPYSFGIGQGLLSILCLIQLARKWSAWKWLK